jgi:copper chaperone CopZ
MTTISVPDMMCENCVKRITNALTAAELKFSVSLDTKTASRQPSASWRIWASRRGSAESLENRGGSPTGPASEQTGAGPVFLRRFYVTNLLLFLFFLQTFAQLDRVIFLQSGRHNTATPTKT